MKKPVVLVEGHDFSFADDGTVVLHSYIARYQGGPATAPRSDFPANTEQAIHVHVHKDADVEGVSNEIAERISRISFGDYVRGA